MFFYREIIYSYSVKRMRFIVSVYRARNYFRSQVTIFPVEPHVPENRKFTAKG